MPEYNKDFIDSLKWGAITVVSFVIILFIILIIFFDVKI